MFEFALQKDPDLVQQRWRWEWWFIKLVISSALVIYLFYSGKISLPILRSFTGWRGLLLSGGSATLILLAQVVTSFRLATLFKAQGLELGFPLCLKTSLMGLFANNFLPTAIGGDAMRGYYLARGRTGQVSEIVATMVFDRLLGFLALILLALMAQGVAWQGNLGWLLQRDSNFHSWLTITGIVMAFSVFSVVLWRRYQEVLRFWLTRLPLGSVALQFLGNLTIFRKHIQISLACLGMSLIPHLICCLAVYLVGQALGLKASLGLTMILAPLIFLTGVLPLSPGNLGWTEYLGSLLWSSQGLAWGGTLWLAYRMVTVLVSLLGTFYYLKFRSKRLGRES